MNDHLAPSVWVTFYNREAYQEETLGSRLVSSFVNFKVIVIDSGSSDRSLKAVECITVYAERVDLAYPTTN